jgi:hypothetical protein
MPQDLHERLSSASPPLDDVSTRRARIRAVAAALVDGPRMSRRFHVPEGVPLHGSTRRRSHGSRRLQGLAHAPRRPATRRLLAAGILLLQVGILIALLASPAFKVHTVDVTGDRMLSRDTVLSAARVPESSLFAVDGDAIRARIAALPWVRSATVTTQLPSTVHIAVTEWQPDVLLRHGGDNALVAGNGAALPLTQATSQARSGVPVLLDYRAGTQQPMPAGFADLLASAAQRWDAAFGCRVDAFVVSNSNVFSAWCSSGWQAIFGALDGSEAVGSIPGQLEVLAALKGRVDFARPTFGYVDLENPSAPAIGGKPGEPVGLRNDIAATSLPVTPATTLPDAGPGAVVVAPSSAATLKPVPTPTPTPTPRPTPTPYVFNLATPTASPTRR